VDDMRREKHGWLVVISRKKSYYHFGPMLYNLAHMENAITDIVWAINENVLKLKNSDIIMIVEI